MYYTNANYHVQNPNDFSGHTYIDKPYTYAAPRLGFVWRPTAAVAIRASAGGGFAEAQLNELIGSNFPPFPNNQSAPTFYQAYLTNVNLQPEKSFAFDIGMDIRAHRGTVLSFDVYHANLYGQFYTSTALTSTNYKGTGLPLYTHAIGNLGASRYEGILADLRHDVPYGIYWTFSGGLTRGFVVGVPAGFYDTAACTNCANLTVVPNINFNGAFTPVSIPYAQGLGRLGYRWNPEKYVDLVATYYGNNNTYFRPAFVELDGHVGYPITRDLAMLLTFENITGIYDSAIQYQTAGNLTGAPAIAGAPSVLTSEMFGPRTVQLTVNIH
jgi:outer membrane receptor protein involved in Fe transport